MDGKWYTMASGKVWVELLDEVLAASLDGEDMLCLVDETIEKNGDYDYHDTITLVGLVAGVMTDVRSDLELAKLNWLRDREAEKAVQVVHELDFAIEGEPDE
jgi:hypothetical protein